MAEVAVVNASPLILLTRVDQLALLQLAAPRVLVPEAALAEFAVKDADAPAMLRALTALRIEIVPAPPAPTELAERDLGAGETAVLSLCLGLRDALAIIDDRQARLCAATLRIPTLGTLGLVIRAKQVGRISNARPLIEQLIARGMFVGAGLQRRVFELLGE